MEKRQEKYAGLHELVMEVEQGEHTKDVLPNSALEFADERQAQYFSNLRENMLSDMAEIIMMKGQQLEELKLLKKWNTDEDV